MQNDNTEIKSSQSTILVESQDDQIENMQNNNTSISDSEICETAKRLERLAKSLNIPNLKQYRSLFKPKENQTNNHHLTSSEEKDSKEQDNKKQDSREQDNKKQDSEKQDSKKKNCFFCKSKKHEDKICPTIIKKKTRGQKRKSDGNSDIPNKKEN